MKWMKVLTMLAACFSLVQSQRTEVLDLPADARTIALGQSTVADIQSGMSGMGNPATLSGVCGINAFYQDRRVDYLDLIKDFSYRNGGIAMETSIGSFSLNYRRMNMGEANATSPAGPEAIGRIKYFDYVGAVSYARTISQSIAIGVTGKVYDHGFDVLWGSNNRSTTPAYLIDVGVLFQSPSLLSSGPVSDQLRAGMSLENFGSNIRISNPYEQGSTYQAPRYWRTGFSWLLAIKKNSGFEFLHFILNGEYRKMLNPDYFDEPHTDFWGVGMEFRLLSLVAFRIGGDIQPYDNVLGKAGRWNLRYGIGVSLVPQHFGYQIPLSVSFEYAAIPLYDVYGPYFGPLKQNQLNAYTIVVSYESFLF